MTWFKMDDSMWGHPKWISIPRGARALWATAGSWCGRFDTEGHVPAHMLTTLGGRRADVDALLRVGLWHRAGDTCEHENCNPQGGGNGWWFHDFLDYNPTAEASTKRRRASNERQQRARQRARELREIERQNGDALLTVVGGNSASSKADSLAESLRESRGVSRRDTRRDTRRESARSHGGCHAPPDPTRPDP